MADTPMLTSTRETVMAGAFAKSPLPIVVLALGVLVAVAACAPAAQGLPEVSPAEIPELEERIAEAPESVPTLIRLGVAYRTADRPDEAVQVLERAVELEPDSPAAAAHLGLAHEAAGQPTQARRAYEAYRAVGASAETLRWIEGRIPLVRRQEMILKARAALAREVELADDVLDGSAVAVLPFIYEGEDPRYAPLGRALSEMIVTDLAQVDRVTVVERLRIQALLDELALAEEERVDPATAARSGRLLGAGRVVQGRLQGDDDLMNVLAGLVASDAADQLSTWSEEDRLEAIFELQNRLTLGLFESMGVELTAAERDRVMEQPTRSLEALLAFGQGLEAEDRGDFQAAAGFYRQAAELDPEFGEVQERAEEAQVTAEAESDLPGDALEEQLVGDPVGERAALDDMETLIPDPMVRDAVSESQGQEGIGRRTLLEIILVRP